MRTENRLAVFLIVLFSSWHAFGHGTPPQNKSCETSGLFNLDSQRLLKPQSVEHSLLQLLQNDPRAKEAGPFLEPHTLPFLVNVVIASSVLQDGPLPAEARSHFMASSRVFEDPVQRIRYGNGEVKLTDDDLQDLLQLLEVVEGGKLTLTGQDVTAWIDGFATSNTEHPITPQLALESLTERISQNRILPGKAQQGSQLLESARRIYQEITLPQIRSDILRALGPDEDWMRLDYNLFRNQLLAYLSADDQAVTLSERQKVEEVVRIAQTMLFPPFSVQDLNRLDQDGSKTNLMNPTVEMALRIYLVKQRGLSFIDSLKGALENPDDSEDAMQSIADSFARRMSAFGYSRRGGIWALSVLQQSL